MEKFYKNRLSRHQTKLNRYLKYVLNDHVVLISLFLFGGFGFYYANFVKTLDANFILAKPLVLFIWLAALLTGGLATLAKDADKVFLLPKEQHMIDYLKASYRHSLVLPFTLLLITSGISMPLLIAVNRSTVTDFAFYLITLLLLKAAHLLIKCQALFLQTKKQAQQLTLIWLVGSLLSLLALLYLAPWFGLILSVVVYALSRLATTKLFQEKNLDWEGMISLEQQRLKKIFQFINLFTDVPGIAGKVKRRKYADGLLKRLPSDQKGTYPYLYTRSFLRGAEFSGLYLRLTLIGVVVAVFLTDFYLILLISLLVIYLIGFQLIPLYSQFDYMVMTQLYPVPKVQKASAVQALIAKLLAVTALLFSLTALIVLPKLQESLIVIGSLGLEIALFTYFYIPSRLKKLSK
ncbi:ABC transporter permease [Vagococcus salmoninarum]|uniref:ABC transporter permease n=1 Tax=Vagococcus salmoninarum TaxID=2739 RepID=UPI003F9C734E